MTDNYGDTDRFVAAAQSLPLDAEDVIPQDSLSATNPPALGFTLSGNEIQPSQIKCFSNAGQKPIVTVLDRRIEIRFAQALAPGRIRVNCTATKNQDSQSVLYWWSKNLVIR